jgi:hypothetical protein
MVFSYEQCIRAAEDVLDALLEVGAGDACLIGGMAARLHGLPRPIKVLSS